MWHKWLSKRTMEKIKERDHTENLNIVRAIIIIMCTIGRRSQLVIFSVGDRRMKV
jgi:hypothetical protein